MKLIRFVAAVVLVLVATLYAATFINLAQAGELTPLNPVVIPYGDWLAAAAGNINTILAALAMWALRKLPAHIVAIIKTAQLDQVLLKAIDFGVNRTAGAAKGRVLTINLANQVLAEAVGYVVDHGPGWLVAWAGGEQGIRDKIIARLDVEATVALQ
jgi:hypothetical protein